jgi:C-terminal processing protease CtpA/Prc
VFFPVLFKAIGNSLIVTHNVSDNETIKPGDEIIAINGIKIKTIIDSLLTVSKADGMNGLNKQLDNITLSKRDIGVKRFTLFDIYFPLFFKTNLNEKNFKITMQQGGKISEVVVKGLSKEQREQQFIARYGAEPQDEKTWYLKEINTNTILFRLGDFSTYNWKFDFKKYLDSVFTQINQKGYKNLIVDIRENEGGADEARDAVLSYLTSKPIGCANPVRRLYRYTSITDSLLPNLDTWDDSYKKPKTGYTKTPDGYFEKQSSKPDCEEIMPNKNHFKGKLFLITDVTNSSATFIMADCIKRNKLGIVVGETTGGTQQGINGGEIIFFYMPKTKIEMDIPLIWQQPTSTKPDAGIKPDYTIPTTKKDIATQNDPQVNFILRHLTK